MTVVMKSETLTLTLVSSVTISASVERKYMAYADAGMSASAALAATSGTVGSSTVTVGNVSALCSSKSATTVESSAGKACEVTVQFASQQLSDEQFNSEFNAYSASVGGSFIELWRRGADYSTGTQNNNDIGGTKVDSQGEPVSVFIAQATITKVRRYTTIPWSGIWNAIGTRNSAGYEGADAGKLLFKGVSVSTVAAGVYEVSYEMMSDGDFHMRQIPTREADGKVKRDPDGKAIEVKLIQPFPSTSNFGNLIG